MELGHELTGAGEGREGESFAVFARSVDPSWIADAIKAAGIATVRRRKLPAEYVVWIVIGMGLLRDRSIQEVVRHLDLVLPDAERGGRRNVTPGAVVQARDRIGEEPLEILFQMTAARWATHSADSDRWRGLAVYGVDGSTLRVPDSAENESTFKRPRGGRGIAGYPQVRIAALMALRSRILAGLAMGPCNEGEVTLAAPLWKKLPDQSLTIVDRGFLSYGLFHQIQSSGASRHWLSRAKKNLRWTVYRELGPNDFLVDLPVTGVARRSHPALSDTLRVRAIRYQRKGFRPQFLLTSLLDAAAYPADEIAELYHERWELEIGFDEIKTHTLEREECLRSRGPDRVRQEIWGLAIGYNLVRLEIERVARRAEVSPRRISYRHALMLIRNFWIGAWYASPGVLPRRLDDLREEMALLILPARRSRRFSRAVKIKMSNYPLKRGPKRRHLI